MTLMIGIVITLIVLGASSVFLFKENKKLRKQNTTLKDSIMMKSKVDSSVKEQMEKEVVEEKINEKSINSRNYF